MREATNKNLNYQVPRKTPVELDEAEREGVEPFGVDTTEKLFSMEGRGRLIQRNRHKHNSQVTQQQLSRKLRPIPWICPLQN